MHLNNKMNPQKREILGSYLNQQQSQVVGARPSNEEESRELVVIPENITLEEFRSYVKRYLELDNYIKKAREVIRDKKKQKDKLSEIISKFMIKFNIEDLNTKDGRIRCKVGYVKSPVNQKVIKEKITDYFKNNENECKEIITKVFEERDKVEKVSLRRLKIT